MRRFQFGDRGGGTYATCRKRCAAYFRSLIEQGFTADDLAYRLFALDPFHDGIFRILRYRMEQAQLDLLLFNRQFCDRITSEAVFDSKKQRSLFVARSRSQCRVIVRLSGVSYFCVSGQLTGSTFDYVTSELSRAGASCRLRIAVQPSKRYCEDHMMVDIVFQSIELLRRKHRPASYRQELAITPEAMFEGIKSPEYYYDAYASPMT